MKFKILPILLISLTLNAQEKPKDILVETETRTINVLEDGELIQKKIKVITTETQTVKTDPSYEGKIDAPRVFPPTKVKKVIYIDNDNDPFYDSKSKIAYYKKDGKYYDFKITNDGFEISNPKNKKIEGRARFSNNSDVYLMNLNGYNGIGYFDNDKFTVEFYDDKGVLIIERFDKNTK